jgi:acetoin:2,6-dichlorophenolindophenol oxidoreductase subunit beta
MDSMSTMRYLAALAAGIRDAMTDDPAVIFLGEDVRQNVRGTTPQLFEDFGPTRVFDMPLSEQAFTGFATGAAMTGWRPIIEYQIPSLLYLVFEQIANQASKIHLMTGGQARVPVTYIVPGSGARMGLAGQHSDHPYALFAHAGVKAVIPATPQLAYDLVRMAIAIDDPVLVFSPAAAQAQRGDVERRQEHLDMRCRVHRSGSDVTVVAVGHLVQIAMKVAADDNLGCSVEVVDPVWVYPLDREGICQSVARTGRLIVLDDGNLSCGLAAEVIATAASAGVLTRPPVRLTRPDITAIPFAVPLELALLPDETQLREAIATMKE